MKTIKFKDFMSSANLSPSMSFFSTSDVEMIHQSFYMVGAAGIVIYGLCKLDQYYRYKDQPQKADRVDLVLRVIIIGLLIVVVKVYLLKIPLVLGVF